MKGKPKNFLVNDECIGSGHWPDKNSHTHTQMENNNDLFLKKKKFKCSTGDDYLFVYILLPNNINLNYHLLLA